MASLNKIQLIGNVGRVDVKTFADGGKKVTASLATTRRWRDRNDDLQEETTWHNLIFYGKQGDFVERYVTKGDCIYVEGEQTYRRYTDRENNQREQPEVRVFAVQLLTRRENDGQQAAAPAPAPTSEDLPF